MMTNVSFNLFDYVRKSFYESTGEDDDMDEQFEHYSWDLVDQAMPHVHNIEKKVRNFSEKSQTSLWNFYHPDEQKPMSNS